MQNKSDAYKRLKKNECFLKRKNIYFTYPTKKDSFENICKKISGDWTKPHNRYSTADWVSGSHAINIGLRHSSVSFLPSRSVLRDNPLACTCDLHWLQQWHLSGRGDVDNQMMSCFSGDMEVPLGSLLLENCSEFRFYNCGRLMLHSVTTGLVFLSDVWAWMLKLDIRWWSYSASVRFNYFTKACLAHSNILKNVSSGISIERLNSIFVTWVEKQKRNLGFLIHTHIRWNSSWNSPPLLSMSMLMKQKKKVQIIGPMNFRRDVKCHGFLSKDWKIVFLF